MSAALLEICLVLYFFFLVNNISLTHKGKKKEKKKKEDVKNTNALTNHVNLLLPEKDDE